MQSPNTMSVRFYTAYHKPSHIVSNAAVQPIHVGAALSGHELGMLRDDSGDHISAKNPFFCELTAQYWAWKNDADSTHIGLQHYRRFLHMSYEEGMSHKDAHGVPLPGFFYGFDAEIGQSAENLQRLCAQYDVIVPDRFDVREIGFRTVREQYGKAEHHFEDDLDIVGEIIAQHHPDYVQAFADALSDKVFYQTNTYLLRRDIFHAYSEWMFDILFRAEARIDAAARTQQEARVFGYLSERLFNAFIRKYRQDHPDTTILEVPLALIQDTKPLEPVPEFFEFPDVAETMHIAVATDVNFAMYCHALVASIIHTRKEDYGISIMLMEGGLSDDDIAQFRQYEQDYPNVRIQVLSMAYAFSNTYLRPPFSKETFYRLILPDLLPNHDKIIYLDADMVAVDDMIDLWRFDVSDAPVAAATDYINVAFQKNGTRSDGVTGALPAKEYAAKILGMEGIEDRYFQAGTLVMNLDILRSRDMSRILVDDLKHNKYWFLDQDVLNKYLARDAKILPQEWNVYYLGWDLKRVLDADILAQLDQAKRDAKIAHYAGIAKPWQNNLHPLSAAFWEHARRTPYYDTLMALKTGRPLLPAFPIPRARDGTSGVNRPVNKRGVVGRINRRMRAAARIYLPPRMKWAIKRVLG